MKLIDQKEFDLISRYEKRVAICKDVLFRIASKNIKIKVGSFFYERGLMDGDQEELNNNICTVCVKGAIVASWIGNFNKVKLADYNFSYLPQDIEDIFGRHLLDVMEQILESTVYAWHDFSEAIKYPLVASFYAGFNDKAIIQWSGECPVSVGLYFSSDEQNSLAVRIMNNIIENKGVLVLDDSSTIQ